MSVDHERRRILVNPSRIAVAAAVVAAALAGTTDASAGARYGGFQTPSRNIVCNWQPDRHQIIELLCTVFSASTLRGQKTWIVNPRGGARVLLLRSNAATDVPTLGYGKRWSRFGLSCDSRFTGLTCKNKSGHGFFLSRQSQRIF